MEQVGDADLLSDITTRQSLRCEFDCKIYKVTCINCSLFTDTVLRVSAGSVIARRYCTSLFFTQKFLFKVSIEDYYAEDRSQISLYHLLVHVAQYYDQ